MKALVFTGVSRVELQEVPEPVTAIGEVLVDVEAAGICGSELHGVSHPGFRQPPLIMGHEFTGRDPAGRRVVVNPIVSCGKCDRCNAGQDQVCRSRSILGIHRPGGFSERVAVPEKQLHPIPETLDWRSAALIEPLANAVHAWTLIAHSQPIRVGVIGAGPMGLVCLLVSRISGASEVEVADLAPGRLELARRLGATTTGSELKGEFDAIFDCVGAPMTRNSSVARLRPGGTAVWLGLLEKDSGVDALDLIRQEKAIHGSFAYSALHFTRAVELAGSLDLSWASEFPLAEGAQIFTDLMNGRTDIAKAVLRP